MAPEQPEPPPTDPSLPAAARSRRGAGAPVNRCSWCGQPLHPVEVHGHVQCARCGINVDPCCGGAPA